MMSIGWCVQRKQSFINTHRWTRQTNHSVEAPFQNREQNLSVSPLLAPVLDPLLLQLLTDPPANLTWLLPSCSLHHLSPLVPQVSSSPKSLHRQPFPSCQTTELTTIQRKQTEKAVKVPRISHLASTWHRATMANSEIGQVTVTLSVSFSAVYSKQYVSINRSK